MADRLLLATDLDRTLLPNGTQPESPQVRPWLARLIAEAGLALAFVSGRHLELVESAIAEFHLPRPDFVIGDVGTTVYRREGDGWREWAEWRARLDADWPGVDRDSLLAELAAIPGLDQQPASRQNRHKLSFFLADPDSGEARAAEARALLGQRGMAGRAVVSVDEITGQGLLDLLPECASKRHALEALMAANGFDRTTTVFCGDSGNDLEVLASGIPAVLVANASEAVRTAATGAAAAAGVSDALYLARGGFRGLNGNYAAGVLEGLVHHQPWLADRLGRETPT